MCGQSGTGTRGVDRLDEHDTTERLGIAGLSNDDRRSVGNALGLSGERSTPPRRTQLRQVAGRKTGTGIRLAFVPRNGSESCVMGIGPSSVAGGVVVMALLLGSVRLTTAAGTSASGSGTVRGCAQPSSSKTVRTSRSRTLPLSRPGRATSIVQRARQRGVPLRPGGDRPHAGWQPDDPRARGVRRRRVGRRRGVARAARPAGDRRAHAGVRQVLALPAAGDAPLRHATPRCSPGPRADARRRIQANAHERASAASPT